MACGIPNGEFSAISVYVESLDFEVDADRRSLLRIKRVVSEAQKQTVEGTRFLLFPAPLSPIIRILRVVKTSLSSTVTILIVFSGTDSFHLNPSVLLFVSL